MGYVRNFGQRYQGNSYYSKKLIRNIPLQTNVQTFIQYRQDLEYAMYAVHLNLSYALANPNKVGRQIPPPVFTSGIYRYLPVWKILLKWQIPANTGKLIFLP